jgi:hypothetical protein
VTAVVLLGDIVERPTQRYLVTEVLNVWEVSMGGSHKGLGVILSHAEADTLQLNGWLVSTVYMQLFL